MNADAKGHLLREQNWVRCCKRSGQDTLKLPLHASVIKFNFDLSNNSKSPRFTLLYLIYFQLTTSFNGTAGFQEIVITSKTQGSVNVETECRSNAVEANKEDDEAFKSAFLDACQAVNNISTVFAVQDDTGSWEEAAAEASETTLSLCNAENVFCPWGYKCVGSTCEHHCSNETCGGNGICTVHGISGDIVCKCESDDFYNYSGDKCSEAELRWEMVLAISGGVGGAIVVLLVTFLGIMYCRHRRSKEISSGNSGYTESERQTRVYQRWDTMRSSRGFGRNMFMPSFFASTASPGATPSYKLHRSEGRTGSVWGANEIDEQFPDFVPRLDHIDTEVDYTINRPQLRL
ncbi:uncharacterized protein LOC124134748 [Haliotis rufescens]|uniref:uncharacterized protein LOC124134748 n=1 Tax=Haliotis rufescens TaxID=6454 RepID=UPI00201F1788|nr:uncharacterized protein LOC124134748 [Haliotis rufescens]